MRFWSRWALGLSLLCACGLAWAEDAAEVELEHSLATDFATPHTKWAKPYARGKTRVLFFCSGHGTVPREGVELMQRFDFDLDAVFWTTIVDTTKQGWHGGEAGIRRMLRLAEKPYDAYVFFGVPPDRLSSEMQVKVLGPVIEGRAGLVLVGCTDPRVLKPEKRVTEVPPFLASAKPTNAFQVGKGRGVLLSKQPDIPYEVGWETEYDYWQERLGRTILWAAAKEPTVDLRVTLDCRAETERGSLPSSFTAAWKNPPGQTLGLSVGRRRLGDLRVPLKGSHIGDAEGLAHFGLGRLKADRYRLEVALIGQKGIENWLTVPLVVTSERRVEAVKLERSWGELGERIKGSVALAGPPLNQERLVVRLRDRRDRILAEAALDPAGPAAFDFPVEPTLPMLVRVEATLSDQDGEVSSAHQYFNVTKRHRGQFNFLIWDVPGGPLAPYAEESLARLGTTLQLRAMTPPRVVAAYDIAWVPYTTRILEKVSKEGVMQPFCWNDEAKVAAHVQGLSGKYRESRQHGVFVYSLGDENDVRGSCLSPECLRAYRQYLAKEYGAVEALNASWGSAYKSFDEVELLKADDNVEAEAKRQKNYPRWFDREAFRSANYVAYCKKYAQAYRQIDPQSKTGFEGAGTFGRGDDLDLFVREMGFWSPYPGAADEVLRSIAPRDFPRANWMGYVKEAKPLIATYWRIFTRGCDAVWWWRWDGIGRFHGFLAPHLGPWPATRELVEETQVVRDGLGDLLLRCEPLDDGIAMLFSQPSCYAGQLEGSYGGVEANHVAWHKALRDLGLQFRYVTDRMLRLGEFDASRYKVLILPRTEAIGPKEAAAIEAFVRQGGTLLADARPGLFDGHLKPLAEGCLDKLFGIRRTGRGAAREGKATLAFGGVELALDKARCDPDIELAGAKAFGQCGDRPLLLVNKVDKGQAILLNLPMTSFPRLEAKETSEAAADLLAAVLASAGAKPALVTRTGASHRGAVRRERTRNLETLRWRNGEMQIAALFRHDGPDEEVAVDLGGLWHVYDLRGRRALGPQRSFGTPLLGSKPTFVVLSPAKLEPVRASLTKEAVAQGGVARLRLESPKSGGLRAVRLRAATPAGQPAEWLHQVVLVGAEPKELSLPIAFNDPAGKWPIRAIDLFTNEEAAVTLTVTERAKP